MTKTDRIKRKIIKTLPPTVVAAFMITLVVFPERYSEATFFGLKVWAVSVLPSLLPFFFLTALFTRLGDIGKIARVSSPLTRVLYRADGVGAYVQLASFLSGYPVGVKLAADLKKSGVIDTDDFNKICTFSSTSGPLFVAGSVGVGMFSSGKIGRILLISHLLGAVLTGICFRYLKNPHKKSAPLKRDEACGNALYESAYSSVISAAVVGVFIAVFYTAAVILTDAGIFTPLEDLLSGFIGEDNARGVCLSLVECTFSCREFAKNATPLSVALAAGAVSLGGASVWCQSAVYIKSVGGSMKTFALSKLTHTVFAFLICLGLISLSGL